MVKDKEQSMHMALPLQLTKNRKLLMVDALACTPKKEGDLYLLLFQCGGLV